MRETLGWKKLECRRHLAAVTILYKSIINLIYLPILDSVLPADPCTRSNHPCKLRHIATDTNAYKYSFFPRTIPLWNSLPVISVTATSPEAFQAHPWLSLEPSATLTNCPMEPYFNITSIVFIFAFQVLFSIISLWITMCVYINLTFLSFSFSYDIL